MAIKNLAKKGKNKSKNMAKSIAKKYLKNSAIKYINTKILLSTDGENLIVDLEKDKIPKKLIEIKHRGSGQRLEGKVENDRVTFPLIDLYEIAKGGTFDFYLKVRTKKFQYKKRIPYTYNNQEFKAILPKENRILRAYSTVNNNISLKLEKRDFDYNIKQITKDGDGIIIKGDLEILNDEIESISQMKIIGRNRLDSQSNNFDLKFEAIDSESENDEASKNGKSEASDSEKENDANKSRKFKFEGIIDEIKTNEENILNLRIDFYLRIYDEDGIYYQNLMDVSNYENYENDENRFLIQIEKGENIYSYYATESRHSFALWITTETSFEKSYTIAKGRTIYNRAAKEPLNEKMVFFESFLGKNYAGNPKYIYETMLEMGLDKKYTFVWAYSGDDKDIIPGNPIIVDRYEAGDYYKYLALSKYWINNIIFPIHTKRPQNVYLQTWHGTPLKKLGYDITIPGPEVEGRQNFYNESRNWDYLISSNPYSTEIFHRAFKYNKKFLELGYPINDIFFKDNTEKIDQLKTNLNIPKDKKVILYAPTWKDDEQNESWEHYFNLEIDLRRLYENFKDEYVVILKMHHLVSENLVIEDDLKDFAIDLSSYGDIQELYIMSDVLITDYSSVFFDYAHSRRPILFFVPDLNHYIENVRGLYLNMEKELPGPLIKNNDELIETITNIDEVHESYKEKYDEFYDRFCSICKGHSGKDIINEIFEKK